MRFSAFIAHATAVFRRHPSLCLFSLLLILATSAATTLCAQDAPQTPPDNSAPYTLHLYSRLVEIPTVILFREGRKPTTLDPQQVEIRLNEERPFHPISLRMEGNDPLSIAILLDVSGDQTDFLSVLQKYFSEWVMHSLHPEDHVSIFALDCDLIESAKDAPADPTILQKGLDLALTTPLTHGGSSKPSCGKTLRLRGSLIFVMRKLSELPGRRVLVLVTSGRDGKGDIRWPQINSEAGIDSVTVFGLTRGPIQIQSVMDVYTLARDSGGLLFAPPPTLLPKSLDAIVSQLRGRYILQFPMPPTQSPIVYRVFVTVPKFDAVTFPSGISVPLPNPAVDHPSTDLPSEAPPATPQPDPRTATPNF
jgi:hypothetical protein